MRGDGGCGRGTAAVRTRPPPAMRERGRAPRGRRGGGVGGCGERETEKNGDDKSENGGGSDGRGDGGGGEGGRTIAGGSPPYGAHAHATAHTRRAPSRWHTGTVTSGGRRLGGARELGGGGWGETTTPPGGVTRARRHRATNGAGVGRWQPQHTPTHPHTRHRQWGGGRGGSSRRLVKEPLGRGARQRHPRGRGGVVVVRTFRPHPSQASRLREGVVVCRGMERPIANECGCAPNRSMYCTVGTGGGPTGGGGWETDRNETTGGARDREGRERETAQTTRRQSCSQLAGPPHRRGHRSGCEGGGAASGPGAPCDPGPCNVHAPRGRQDFGRPPSAAVGGSARLLPPPVHGWSANRAPPPDGPARFGIGGGARLKVYRPGTQVSWSLSVCGWRSSSQWEAISRRMA